MSGLEQAIRNALDRADRASHDVRSRIYQSARNALETGLRKQEITDLALIVRQRERLEETIRQIEDEELDRLGSIAQVQKVMLETEPEQLDAPAPVAVRMDDEPEIDSVLTPDVRPDPPASGPETEIQVTLRAEEQRVLTKAHLEEDDILADLAAGRDGEAQFDREEEDPAWAAAGTPAASRVTLARRNRIGKTGSTIIAAFVYSVILGFVAAGGWWVYSTGLMQSFVERSGNIPDVTPQVDGGDFDPAVSPLDPQRGFSVDWMDIYKPGSGKISGHGNVKVDDVEDSDGKAVLISSTWPDASGEAEIMVPANVLQDLAGKSVIFAITVKTEGDKPTQIYVECDFTTLGGCGRHRYFISQDRADQLFKVDFASKLAPNTDGRILINSDVTGGGGAVRLYGVRVLPGGG